MPRPTIVAIDDELEFTKAMARYFVPRGYDVRIALNGPGGLQLVQELQPEVVLIDLKMSGIDGDEVLRVIRRDHPRTQVIVITAYSDEGRTQERVMALGAFAHFEKPISSMRHLAHAVEQAVTASASS